MLLRTYGARWLTAAALLVRRLIHTPYELNFRVERDHTVLCTKELSGRELKKFRKVRLQPSSPRLRTLLCDGMVVRSPGHIGATRSGLLALHLALVR